MRKCIYGCFFFQAEDGIRDHCVTGVQTCALPILPSGLLPSASLYTPSPRPRLWSVRISEVELPIRRRGFSSRSEEHTSELQSHSDLVCRLLLEKKKKRKKIKREKIETQERKNTAE